MILSHLASYMKSEGQHLRAFETHFLVMIIIHSLHKRWLKCDKIADTIDSKIVIDDGGHCSSQHEYLQCCKRTL